MTKNTDNELLSPEQMQKEIDFLSELMLPERYEVIKRVVKNRTNYITVCLENIHHSQNASAILRTCEAFGVQNVHIIENISAFKPNVDVVKGTDKWLDINICDKSTTTTDLVKKLRAEGYRIVAACPHSNGVSCDNFDVERGKIALFFGTEKAGISDELKSLADEFITIPMYGFVESLNVSVCAAISLQSMTEKLHESSVKWELTDMQQLRMLNRWMKYSVKDSENILLLHNK